MIGEGPGRPTRSFKAANWTARVTFSDNGFVESWQLRDWFSDYLDACNGHDLEALRGLIDPSVRRAHLASGADAWIADLADLFGAFPDWQWKRIQLVVEDDRIAAHLRAGGTHTGAFHGIAPTRRHVNVAEFGFFRVVKGRVVEYSGTADNAELAALLTGARGA